MTRTTSHAVGAGERADIDRQIELACVLRLALTSTPENVRVYAARLAQKYRKTEPAFARQIDEWIAVRGPMHYPVLRGQR